MWYLNRNTVNDESLEGLKFDEFGESQVIRQTKVIQTLHYIIIIINSQCHSPNFPSPNLLRTEFTKLSLFTVLQYDSDWYSIHQFLDLLLN